METVSGLQLIMIGLIAGVGQRKGGVAAAIVELDALADAVWAAAEDDHFFAIRELGLVAVIAGKADFVGRVHVGGGRGELGRAGIDALEDRLDLQLVAGFAHLVFGAAGEVGQACIGKAHGLEHAEVGGILRQAVLAHPRLHAR